MAERPAKIQQDWVSKTIAGTVLGLALALAAGGAVMRLSSATPMIAVQFAMWVVPPVWMGVLTALCRTPHKRSCRGRATYALDSAGIHRYAASRRGPAREWRGPTTAVQPEVQAKPIPRNPVDMLPPAELLAKVKAIAPDFVPKTMQYAQVIGPRATVRIWGFDDKDIARPDRGGLVRIDPYSGNILDTELLPGQQPPAAVTLTSFFTLH